MQSAEHFRREVSKIEALGRQLWTTNSGPHAGKMPILANDWALASDQEGPFMCRHVLSSGGSVIVIVILAARVALSLCHHCRHIVLRGFWSENKIVFPQAWPELLPVGHHCLDLSRLTDTL